MALSTRKILSKMTTENWDPDLVDEVYSARIHDLVEKLDKTITEASHPTDEIISALGCLLTLQFFETEDPERAFRLFILRLSENFDKAMDIE